MQEDFMITLNKIHKVLCNFEWKKFSHYNLQADHWSLQQYYEKSPIKKYYALFNREQTNFQDEEHLDHPSMVIHLLKDWGKNSGRNFHT